MLNGSLTHPRSRTLPTTVDLDRLLVEIRTPDSKLSGSHPSGVWRYALKSGNISTLDSWSLSNLAVQEFSIDERSDSLFA